ncbi:unnamed protein product [Peniophora sp. CBMAI 1063]|nr:unnamed protein product [Peniophora sp. CBMAI 1063]
MSKPIKTPEELVLAFKKSGEFDRLRKQLLAQFQSSAAMETLTARVDDIAKRKLTGDEKLARKAPEEVHREVMQELDRYPILERALADLALPSDPAFTEDIQSHAKRLLQDSRAKK